MKTRWFPLSGVTLHGAGNASAGPPLLLYSPAGFNAAMNRQREQARVWMPVTAG